MDMSDILFQFYAAGWDGQGYPIDLRKISNPKDRRTARKAHAEGVHFQARHKVFLRRMCGR